MQATITLVADDGDDLAVLHLRFLLEASVRPKSRAITTHISSFFCGVAVSALRHNL